TISCPVADVNGSWPLILVGETRKSGINWPFTVTHESPSTVGAGLALLETVLEARFDPSTLTNPPAVRFFGSLVLVSTTLVMTGFTVVASKFEGSVTKPDCVSEIIVPFESTASDRMNCEAAEVAPPEATVPPAAVAVGNRGVSTVRV